MPRKFCTVCGTKVEGNTRFCTGCGADLSEKPAEQPVVAAQPLVTQQPVMAAQSVVTQQPVMAAQPVMTQQPMAVAQQTEYVPGSDSPYEPIKAGGYIGIMLLMMFPIVGILLTIVWACGGCRKINKRNLARANLILMLIGAVLGVVLFIIFRVSFAQYF